MNSNLSFVLPNSLEKSLLCFTFIDSRVLGSAPDIAICTSNGYLYEFKRKKIVGSLNINKGNASTISVYHLYEKCMLILYYLVFTNTNQLILVKRANDKLQKLMIYNDVKEFEVYDFQCIGYPQIKINFFSCVKTEAVEFPVCKTTKTNIYEDDCERDTIASSLSEKYLMMNMHISELSEECNNIKNICFTNNVLKKDSYSLLTVGVLKFSSQLKEKIKPNIKILSVCCNMDMKNCILGMLICNTGEVILDNFELIVIQQKIDKYSYCCFLSTSGNTENCLYPSILDSTAIKPGQEIFVTVVFAMPAFVLESQLPVTCYLTSPDFENCVKLQELDVGITELIIRRHFQIDRDFTDVHLMAIMTTKVERRITIESATEERNLIESVLVNNLGFLKIKHYYEKFFYCTTTYLNEVGIALQENTLKQQVWNLNLYARNVEQVYFLVNALYDLLPEKTTILYSTE